MRDGSTRRRSTSPQETTWTPDRVQLQQWRQDDRLADLRLYAQGAASLPWSLGLLNALLEELHLSDDFDAIVGKSRRSAKYSSRLIAIALLLRHSWHPDDLDRTAIRLGLMVVTEAIPPTESSTPPRDRGHRRRESRRVALAEPTRTAE